MFGVSVFCRYRNVAVVLKAVPELSEAVGVATRSRTTTAASDGKTTANLTAVR